MISTLYPLAPVPHRTGRAVCPHPALTFQPPAGRRTPTKQTGVGPFARRDPTTHRRTFSTPEPFIPPSHPRSQGLIEMAKDLNTPRPIKPAIIVHPATHHRVDELGQILQGLIIPGGSHPPLPDGMPDRLSGRGADRWQKAHEKLPATILCPPRLEGVAEEVKRYMLVLPRVRGSIS
jgi:hypothetical protein